jgi:hypothetical protein
MRPDERQTISEEMVDPHFDNDKVVKEDSVLGITEEYGGSESPRSKLCFGRIEYGKITRDCQVWRVRSGEELGE